MLFSFVASCLRFPSMKTLTLFGDPTGLSMQKAQIPRKGERAAKTSRSSSCGSWLPNSGFSLSSRHRPPILGAAGVVVFLHFEQGHPRHVTVEPEHVETLVVA